MAKRHPLHSICPYFAMFPEDFVERHVLAYTKPGDLVFDPFSGRGTTPFQSLLMGRRAAGTDINPVAACISGAKVDAPNILAVLARIDELEGSYVPSSIDHLPIFFGHCFHPNTLPQVDFLRRVLVWGDDRTDRFIAAMALGALHGESHRSPMYFSNRMPRTISTKPEYSVRWWQSREMIAPERDVFAILRQMAKFRLADGVPEIRGVVRLSDARCASAAFPELCGQVKLVVTSPPYVDVTDYAEDQWLRLWFLGGENRPVAKSYSDDRHTRKVDYWEFLRQAGAGLRDLLAPDSIIVIRIGGKLELDELENGLSKALCEALGDNTVSLRGAVHTSELRRRQTNAFRPGTKAGVEHDFVFTFKANAPSLDRLLLATELA